MTSAQPGIPASCTLILLAAVLVACASPSGTTAATTPRPATTTAVSVAPANLDMTCSGDGAPTVVLVPGLGTDGSAFRELQDELAESNRVCSYSRAGLGGSPPWPEDLEDPSAGDAADQLLATLDAREETGPFVMLGWSYGGVVAQAFAVRHGELLAGLVLEDAATPELFDSPGWDFFSWTEGGRDVDTAETTDELEGLDLGDLPLIVLTQGTMEDWPDPELWVQTQDRLATLSDDVLHVIATEAGHAVHWDAEALVIRAVNEVVGAVRSNEPLPACDDHRWRPLTGECRVP